MCSDSPSRTCPGSIAGQTLDTSSTFVNDPPQPGVGATSTLGAVIAMPAKSTSYAPAVELQALEAVIIDRANADPEASYTAKLWADRVLIRRKIMEEAFEVTVELEADRPDPQRVSEEAADLLYHLMVGLAAAGVPISAVLDELEARRR